MSRSDAEEALVVDPGDDPGQILDSLQRAGLRCVAILVTHGHFDHIGAVAPLAQAARSPVYISSAEDFLLRHVNDFLFPGFGPFPPYRGDFLLEGGEALELAGLSVRVLETPGHSPAGLTYLIAAADGDQAAFVGDVLFAGGVGRTDLPGGGWPTLERSILRLCEHLPREVVLYSGHGPATTLGEELRGNPFLQSSAFDAARAA